MNLASNWPLITRYGMTGAAISTGLTEAVVTLMCLAALASRAAQMAPDASAPASALEVLS